MMDINEKRKQIREALETIVRVCWWDCYNPEATVSEILAELEEHGVVIKMDTGDDLTGAVIARLEPLIEEQ